MVKVDLVCCILGKAGITGYTNLLRHEPVKAKYEHDMLTNRVIFLKHEHDTKINW